MGCRLLRNNRREELSSVHNCSPAVHFWEMADIAGYEVVSESRFRAFEKEIVRLVSGDGQLLGGSDMDSNAVVLRKTRTRLR